MSENVIETQDLTVYYGKHRGILDVNLTIEKGEVFGFLGPNGAGKTTTQRVLLDVFPPTSGRATVFGLDCQKEGVKIRQQIGYLPGELALYSNMKARDFFKMYEFLRGENGTKDYWQELADRLDLDTSRKISQFSRGNKQKVGVVAAFMNRADLLNGPGNQGRRKDSLFFLPQSTRGPGSLRSCGHYPGRAVDHHSASGGPFCPAHEPYDLDL